MSHTAHPPSPPPAMRPTAGVTTTAAHPETPDAPREPVLFDDIEPVYLVRLYPDAVKKGGEAAREAAMAAGKATAEAGAKLIAAQQQEIVFPPAEGA